MRRLVLQSFFPFFPPTHLLYVPSCIDRGELLGIAVKAPAPLGSTRMPSGPRHLATNLLQRWDTGNTN